MIIINFSNLGDNKESDILEFESLNIYDIKKLNDITIKTLYNIIQPKFTRGATLEEFIITFNKEIHTIQANITSLLHYSKQKLLGLFLIFLNFSLDYILTIKELPYNDDCDFEFIVSNEDKIIVYK